MTKALLVAAALGLSIAGANACEAMRSAAKTDNMTVASTTATQSMSTPESKAATDAVRADKAKEATAPADERG
ncbi:hypothetical protein AB4144_18865 [Rhizobiaceae sp. 2RAB30]